MDSRPVNALAGFLLNRPLLCGALAGTLGVWLLVGLQSSLRGQWPGSWFNALLLLSLGAVSGALGLRALAVRRRRMLTMCMHCHAVKEDHGGPGKEQDWLSNERYLAQALDAEVSHGICPHCQVEHYNGLLPPRLSASHPEQAHRA